MRVVLYLCVCVSVAMGQDVNAMRNMPKYDERYDYLDIDAVLDSKRLVRNYVDCLINVKPCTPEGKALKRLLPEALRTKCVRCSERQKKTAVKVIRRLKNEYPEEWAKLASRWDPTGDFTRFFEEFLAQEHFNTISNTVANEIPGAPSLPPPPPPRVPTVLTVAPAPVPVQPARPPSLAQPVDSSTPPRPIILNRFGDDGELITSSSSNDAAPRPTAGTSKRPATVGGSPRPVITSRPTQTTWTAAASDTAPTRFPLRPAEMSPPYTTAITLIDQLGYKIIRTTELVTDILRNTVRAVVGR